MIALRRLSAGRRRLLLALVVAALAVRALVPSGWMVAPGADGVPRLTLCSGTGVADLRESARAEAAMAHAMPGMHHGAGHDAPAHPEHPCAFSGIGLAAALPALDAPRPPTPPAAATPARRDRAVAVGRGLAAPPPPATGPPAIA